MAADGEALELFDRVLWSPYTTASRHNHWCTPQWIVDLLLLFWPEGIDCDPCTNECSIVPARRRYDGSTPEKDGLLQSWRGAAPEGRLASTYANPPYSDPGPWYERAAHQALTTACEILLLVNVTTSTRAWNKGRPRQPPLAYEHEIELCRRGIAGLPRATAVGFFDKRIGFLDAGAPIKSNEYEQMILYWGPRVAEFRRIFGGVAWCP